MPNGAGNGAAWKHGYGAACVAHSCVYRRATYAYAHARARPGYGYAGGTSYCNANFAGCGNIHADTYVVSHGCKRGDEYKDGYLYGYEHRDQFAYRDGDGDGHIYRDTQRD